MAAVSIVLGHQYGRRDVMGKHSIRQGAFVTEGRLIQSVEAAFIWKWAFIRSFTVSKKPNLIKILHSPSVRIFYNPPLIFKTLFRHL